MENGDNAMKVVQKRTKSMRALPSGCTEYQVAGSDTLPKIALRCNSTPSEISRLNRLSCQLLFPGQTLFIPKTIENEPENFQLQNTQQNIITTEPNGINATSLITRPFSPDDQIDALLQRETLHSDADEISSDYLKIDSKVITDGQGVVSGVLLVTPQTVMFNPSVSDHLVIERGREAYLIRTPIKSICAITFYKDIAALILDEDDSKIIPQGDKVVGESAPITPVANRKQLNHSNNSTNDNTTRDHDITEEETASYNSNRCPKALASSTREEVSFSELTNDTSEDKSHCIMESNQRDEVIDLVPGRSTPNTIPDMISDHDTKTETMSDQNKLTDTIMGHSITSDEILDHTTTSDVLSDHATTSDTTSDHAITSDTISDHALTSDTTSDHALTSDTISDHATTSDTISDHATTSDTMSDRLNPGLANDSSCQSIPSPSISVDTTREEIDHFQSENSSKRNPLRHSSKHDHHRPLMKIFREDENDIDLSKDSGFSGSDFSSVSSTRHCNTNGNISPPPSSVGNRLIRTSSLSEEAKVWLGKRGVRLPSESETPETSPTEFEDLMVPRPAKPISNQLIYVALKVKKSFWSPHDQRRNSIMGLPPNRDQLRRENWFAVPKGRVDQLYSSLLTWCPNLDEESVSYSQDETSGNEEGLSFVENSYSLSPGYSTGIGKAARSKSTTSSNSSFPGKAILVRNAEDELPELIGDCQLLTKKQIGLVSKNLPSRTIGHSWSLAYSTAVHGMSLRTLYRNMETLDSPVLLLIRDDEKQLFGTFMSNPPSVSDGFYGTGESMLFSFVSETDLRVYRWSGDNYFFIKGDPRCLTIGGGDGQVGLWLDEDLYHGRSHSCKTFNNETLSHSEDFICSALEAWTFV